MQVLTAPQSNAITLLGGYPIIWKLVQRLKNFVTFDVRHDIILQYKTLPNNMIFFNLRSHRLKMAWHFPRPVSPTAAGFL